ncbi:MAG: hypothetical protein WBM14_13075 [Terracidiphilus sp.]|jgi:hypothetical protein
MTPGETAKLKQLASAYKQKIQDKRARDAEDLKALNLVKSEGPAVWAEMRQKIKQSVDMLNCEIGDTAISWDDPHSDRIVMTRAEGSIRLEGGFDLAAHAAFFRCPQAAIDMRLVLVVDGGKVEFAPVDQNMMISGVVPRPEDVAYGLVRDLLNC